MRKIFFCAILWALVFVVGGYAAKQTVNLGTGPTTGDGDTVRVGFQYVNENFDELYATDKGDLVVGTAANTVVQLTVGADNEVPVADSGEASGINWGKIEPASIASITPGAGVDEYALTYEHTTTSWELTALGGSQNLWDDVTADGATSAAADGPSDAIEFEGGTGITTTASDVAGAAKVSIAWDGTALTGDVTGTGTTSIATTLAADVVGVANMTHEDHGEITWATGAAEVDGGVIDGNNMADADHGDIVWATGNATLDADVVAPAEMADADHGDITWATGVANIDAGVVGTTELTNDSILEIDLDATNAPTDDYILSYDATSGGYTWVVDATGGGAGEFWKTAVADSQAAGADAVADIASDTITFAGGTGISTVSADDAESITINWDGTTLTGDVTGTGTTSIATTLANDVVGVANMTHEDHGEVTWATGAAEVDGGVIDANNMADADHGDITWATGAVSIDADTIDSDNMADDDHGELTWLSGNATIDGGVIDANNMADADHGDIIWATGAATLDADVVSTNEMADADHGDFSWSSGVGTLDNDVVAPAEMADADHGDVTWATGVATLDNDVVAPAEMADADHGEITWATGVATIDGGVIDNNNMADADHGEITWATGNATLDADVVAQAEMADADHGEITWLSGTATIDGGVIDANNMANADHGDITWSTGVANIDPSTVTTLELDDSTILEIDINATNAAVDDYILSFNQAEGNFTWVPDATGGTVNSFATHDIPGATDPVADLPTDTLQWINGTGIEITGTDDPESITITSTVVDTDTQLTRQQVDDFVDELINDLDSVHTNITITYDDADDAMDFVVDPHDSLTGVDPNEHVDHSTVTLTAGTGLTGGGDITASREFAVADNYLLNTGDTGNGDYNFGLSTNSFEIPNDATPTLPDVAGEIAIDTDFHSASQGAILWHDGVNVRYVVSTSSGAATSGYVPKFNGTTVTWAADDTGSGAPDQNLYSLLRGDSGTATAGSTTADVTFSGGTGITTTVDDSSPDYVLIDWEAAITDLSDVTDKTGNGTIVAFSVAPEFSSLIANGIIHFGNGNSLQIPNPSPTVDFRGEMGMDTDGISASQGEIVVYDGQSVLHVVATTDDTPVTGDVPKFNGSTVTWEPDGGGGGGDPNQDLFFTIGGDGSTSVDADDITDTLNIVGGTGIETTASDTGTDTLSIAWTGTSISGAVIGSGTTSISTSLSADVVFDTHMGNDDHGDVQWSAGVASVEAIRSSATPTLSATDNIAIDTTVTDHQSMLKYYSATGTQEMTVIALPTSNLTDDDNYVIKYDALTNTFGMEVDATGGAGSTVPGGINTELQYNDGGAFDGSQGTDWDKATHTLTITAQSNTATPLTVRSYSGVSDPDTIFEVKQYVSGSGWLTKLAVGDGNAGSLGHLFIDDGIIHGNSGLAGGTGWVEINSGAIFSVSEGAIDPSFGFKNPDYYASNVEFVRLDMGATPGVSESWFSIDAEGTRNVELFEDADSGDTYELIISGYTAGQQKRSLGIGVGKLDYNTVSFDYHYDNGDINGAASYSFDGNIILGATDDTSPPTPTNDNYVIQLADNSGEPDMPPGTAGLYSTGGELYAVDDDDNEFNLTDASGGGGGPSWSVESISASSDAVNVTDDDALLVDCSSADVVIGGLVGGVTGQVLLVVMEDENFSLTIEHDEGNNQAVWLSSNADETIYRQGGWELVFDGIRWIEAESGQDSHIVNVERFFESNTGSGYGTDKTASSNLAAVQDAINYSWLTSGYRGAHIQITGYLEISDDIQNKDTSSGSTRIPLIVDGLGSGHVKQTSASVDDAAFKLNTIDSSAGIASDWLTYLGAGTAIVFEIKNMMISAGGGRCVLISGSVRQSYCQISNCQFQSTEQEAIGISNSWAGFFRRLSFVHCYPYAIYATASTNLVFEDIKVIGAGMKAYGSTAGGGASHIDLASSASSENNEYVGDVIYVDDASSSSTSDQQKMIITAYIGGTTKRAYVSPYTWPTFIPAVPDTYEIYHDTTEPAVSFGASGSVLNGHFEDCAGDALQVTGAGNDIRIWSEACNRSAENIWDTSVPHVQNAGYYNRFHLMNWPTANSSAPHLSTAAMSNIYCTDAEAKATMETNWDRSSGLDIEKIAGHEDAADASNDVGSSSSFTRCYWSLGMLEDLGVNLQTRAGSGSFKNYETDTYSYAARKGSTIECKIKANEMTNNYYIDVFDLILDPGFNGHDYDANSMCYARVRYSVSPASYYLNRRREDSTGTTWTNNRVLRMDFKDDAVTGNDATLRRDGYAFCDGVHEITATGLITTDGDISENQFYLWVTNGDDTSHSDVYITIHECEFAIGEPNN